MRKYLMIIILLLITLLVNSSVFAVNIDVRRNLTIPAIRPGIDGKSWNGAVFIGKGEAIFGVRVGLFVKDKYITGDLVYNAVNKVGPRAPDGSYACLIFGEEGHNITLNWSVQEEGVILCSVSPSEDNTTIAIETYFPWDYPGEYHLAEDGFNITGTAPGVLTDKEAWAEIDKGNNSSYFRLTTLRKPEFAGTTDIKSIRDKEWEAYPDYSKLSCAIRYEYDLKGKRAAFMKFTLNQDEVLTFKAAIADKPIENWQDLSPEMVLKQIEQAKKTYEVHRFKGSGMIGKAARALTNEEFWMFIYQPNHGTKAKWPRTFAPAGRPWIEGAWATWAWDPMFQSYVAALDDEYGAYSTVFSTLLASQMENGVIPNDYQAYVWGPSGPDPNDHSQPPVASYFVWKLYQRFHNKEFLQVSYPALTKWYDWWLSRGPDGLPRRDGNQDGLLEWGCDYLYEKNDNQRMKRLAAVWETGLDDSPMWDDVVMKGIHMNLNSIWLNSLRALDAMMMSKIASELGDLVEVERYESDYQRMKKLINDNLWKEELGMYLSRYWDGEWEYDDGIPTITPASFTVLLAGIPSKERAERMIKEHLLNPEEFWGEYVVPTINKNHPDYKPPYTYWRGTIWPPTNYLLYEGLKRYGYDKTAALLAEKSTLMWLGPWEKNNWAMENYDPETGKKSSMAHIHQGWSMNLPLLGIQEMIDIEPWQDDLDSIRFGSLGLKGRNELNNVKIHGYNYDLVTGPFKTILYRDGEKIFEAIGGRVLVRNFKKVDKRTRFTIKTEKDVKVILYLDMFEKKIEKTVTAGITKLEVTDDELKIISTKSINYFF